MKLVEMRGGGGVPNMRQITLTLSGAPADYIN